jgi:hypothetical protein
VRRAPKPGPVQGDRVELSNLHLYAPSSSLRGTRGEVSTTPIDQVADCGFLVELLSGNSSGRPFDRGWLVVQRLVHESACAGVLGGARSRSLGTEGAEALPRWDPPD